MIKTKFFWKSLDTDVQEWLDANQNIEIISTNLSNSDCGWSYAVTYNDSTDTSPTDIDRVVTALESIATNITIITTDITAIKTKLDNSSL